MPELLDESLQYNTIGSHKSAISGFYDPTECRKIGSNWRVSDLMSAIFNQRLPQPKYTFIWEIEVVLEYLTNLPENNFLSGKALI